MTFPYGDPLRAADINLLFKHAARTIAAQAGLVANFMAAPATGIGSGCHIHSSLLDRDGLPLFAETDGKTPDKARHAIGGLLDVLPHLALLYARTPNSYRRYVPTTFAPTTFTWGRDNRTCAIRVVGHGDNVDLENRLPGADTNPYLAIASVLAAALSGLDHKADPPPLYIGNAFEDAQAPPVPGSLEEALAALRSAHPRRGRALQDRRSTRTRRVPHDRDRPRPAPRTRHGLIGTPTPVRGNPVVAYCRTRPSPIAEGTALTPRSVTGKRTPFVPRDQTVARGTKGPAKPTRPITSRQDHL